MVICYGSEGPELFLNSGPLQTLSEGVEGQAPWGCLRSLTWLPQPWACCPAHVGGDASNCSLWDMGPGVW